MVLCRRLHFDVDFEFRDLRTACSSTYYASKIPTLRGGLDTTLDILLFSRLEDEVQSVVIVTLPLWR
jgi:hypothetical protein